MGILIVGKFQFFEITGESKMTFQYILGEPDTYIQFVLLIASLVFAIMGIISSDAVKGKKKLGISLLFVILYLMLMQFEVFAYGIGQG